jgi:hypothetical protein
VAPCSLVDVYRRFEEMCSFHLKDISSTLNIVVTRQSVHITRLHGVKSQKNSSWLHHQGTFISKIYIKITVACPPIYTSGSNAALFIQISDENLETISHFHRSKNYFRKIRTKDLKLLRKIRWIGLRVTEYILQLPTSYPKIWKLKYKHCQFHMAVNLGLWQWWGNLRVVQRTEDIKGLRDNNNLLLERLNQWWTRWDMYRTSIAKWKMLAKLQSEELDRRTCEDNINLLINRVWGCGLDSNGSEQSAVGLSMNLWVL